MKTLLVGAIIALCCLVAACVSDDEATLDESMYGPVDATELATVPAGWFTMGSDYDDTIDLIDGTNDEPFSDEHPEHRVWVSTYAIETHEVTNAQYRACVGEDACVDAKGTGLYGMADYYTNRQYDDLPMVNVDWAMAEDYCRWRGRRLPTEAEWEKAARGATDDRTYPWGWREPSCELANISIPKIDSFTPDATYTEQCHGEPIAVGSYPLSASTWGATEMVGNVAEWTADYYAYDYYDATVWPGNDQDPTGPESGERRVVRGGSYAATAVFARVSFRDSRTPDYFDGSIGFRCVGEVEP